MGGIRRVGIAAVATAIVLVAGLMLFLRDSPAESTPAILDRPATEGDELTAGAAERFAALYSDKPITSRLLTENDNVAIWVVEMAEDTELPICLLIDSKNSPEMGASCATPADFHRRGLDIVLIESHTETDGRPANATGAVLMPDHMTVESARFDTSESFAHVTVDAEQGESLLEDIREIKEEAAR